METKSYNVFAELGLSCFNLGSYNAIRKNKFGKRFLYHLILTVLVFLITFGISYILFVSKTGGVQGIIEEHVPDFELTDDGYLIMDESYEWVEDGIMIMADTDTFFAGEDGEFFRYDWMTDEWESLGFEEDYQAVALLDSELMIIYTSDQGYREMYYDELVESMGAFDRQSVIDLCNVFIPIIGIFLFVGTFIGILWGAFVNSIILLIISSIMGGTKLPYMELYTVSLYAMTPFELIFAILSALSISIPFKSWIELIAIAVYSAVIINKIKKDNAPQMPQMGMM
ncbi:MAG: DUF1189 domain-containing protein [Acetatifactor sp.]|nr:DUF1189 domain-containing protein [Acetatifactor sp.]